MTESDNLLEMFIQSTYQRLRPGKVAFLLRNSVATYDELPDPESVENIYKASVTWVAQDYASGVNVVDWPNFSTEPESRSPELSYNISPREMFLTGEMLNILRHQTSLPYPRRGRLNRNLESKGGRFRAILGAEMARVILERFQHDPRTDDGRLTQKR